MFSEGDDGCVGQGQAKQKRTLSHSSLQTAMLLLGRHLAVLDRRARKVCPTVPHSPLLFSRLIGPAEVQKVTLANEGEGGRRSPASMNVARVFGIPDANQGAVGCLHHPHLTEQQQLLPFLPKNLSWRRERRRLCCQQGHQRNVTTLRPPFQIWGKIRET